MSAINSSNQITKLDYPTKNLRENVIIKQQSSKEELGSASLERDVCSRGNNAVTKEPPKLDKESIVGLQEEKLSGLESKKNSKPYLIYSKKITANSYGRSVTLPSTVKSKFLSQDLDKMFQAFLKPNKDFYELVKLYTGETTELKVIGRKAVFSTLDHGGNLKPVFIMEVDEDENNIILKSQYDKDISECRPEYHDEMNLLLRHISLQDKEDATEKETPIVNSSYFLDKYLKQKNVANKFVADQLIDKKLQSVLKFV